MRGPGEEEPRVGRRWLPILGVLAALILLVGGGYVGSGLLSEPAGPATTVSGVVQIQPLSGWSYAGRGTLSPGVEFARLTRGGGSIDVIAYPGVGRTPEALAEIYKGVLEGGALSRLSVSTRLESIRTAAGLPGVRFSYSGVVDQTSTPIDGEVTVVVGPSGSGAVFNGWAPAGLLSYASGDIDSMVEEAIVA